MAYEFRYQLLNSIGYKFSITDGTNYPLDNLALNIKSNFPDIEITRPKEETNMRLLDTKALVTINGFIYPTLYTNDKLLVPKATLSMLKTRSNHVGCISFNTLPSPITKIPLTEATITKEDDLTPLYDRAIITFNEPVENFILVIGGYMIFEDPNHLFRISDNSFVLTLRSLDYIERLYETERHRDIFSELGINVSPNNPTMVDATQVRSDEVITKYLTTFNSFLVKIPSTLSTSKLYLEHSKVPGNFRTEVEPKYPLIVGYGKVGEYSKRKANDYKYNVYVEDAYYNRHLYSYLPMDDIDVINAHRIVGNTYRLSSAYFLQMTGT